MERNDRGFLSGTVRRRAMLAATFGGFAAGCAPRKGSLFFAPQGTAVGVQLYSVAKELGADLDGTLAAIAAIGYRTVELAGYAGKSPVELRKALDLAGLRCTSAHVAPRSFRTSARTLDDDLDLLATEARILGFDTVIMPMFVTPPHLPLTLAPGQDLKAMINGVVARMTADDWHRCADYMNAKGAGLKERGLRFGYHNHSIEFGPAGDRTIIDLLIENTDPALVSFELDCGWAAAAGVDPTDFILRHRTRVSALHIKDVAASNRPNSALDMDAAEVGRGVIDWTRLLAASRRAGVDRFFVEKEAPYTQPVFESLRAAFTYLSAIPG